MLKLTAMLLFSPFPFPLIYALLPTSLNWTLRVCGRGRRKNSAGHSLHAAWRKAIPRHKAQLRLQSCTQKEEHGVECPASLPRGETGQGGRVPRRRGRQEPGALERQTCRAQHALSSQGREKGRKQTTQSQQSQRTDSRTSK